jgi:hypothetical protein
MSARRGDREYARLRFVDESPSLAPPHELAGALQRGRGCAARQLLARPTDVGAASLVLDCITNDPRWDRQIESRDRYYAELVLRLDVPLAPLERHVQASAGDPKRERSDDGLALGVLERLAEHGLAAAVSVLERLPHENDDLGVHTPPAPKPLVDASLSTEALLVGAPPWTRHTLLQVLDTRASEIDRATMARVALEGDVADRLAAYEALGRHGDERLVDHAVALLEAHAANPDHARLHRRERVGPSRYLGELRPELTLPLARRWFHADFPLHRVAEDILIRHATRDDAPIVSTALERAWHERALYRLCSCVEILTNVSDWSAAALVCEIDEAINYSYARRWTTSYLVGADIPTSRARLVDALWDCEDDVVLLGLDYVPRTALPRARVVEIATSVWYDAELHEVAAERAAEHDR